MQQRLKTPLVIEQSSPNTRAGGSGANGHYKLRMQPQLAKELSGK